MVQLFWPLLREERSSLKQATPLTQSSEKELDSADAVIVTANGISGTRSPPTPVAFA
jgi:hypothetical protein